MPTDIEPASSIWSVFLSSTIRDFKDFRARVQGAVEKAKMACFLSEKWVNGYDDTVERCRARVHEADAFFLLLGYWYGFIPAGQERSITHLEFDWAYEKWKDLKFPPMAVMVPGHRSKAKKALQEAAARILRSKAGGKQVNRKEHTKRLTQFREKVIEASRTVVEFEDAHELRENVIVKCLEWKGETFIAAARRRTGVAAANPVTSQVSDEQLGALGRGEQFTAATTALTGITEHDDEPAIALLVHGPEDAGQRAFLSRLAATRLKNHYPKSRLHRLPPDQNRPEMLPSWVAGQIGLEGGAASQSPAQLAERVASELKRQPLYFVLDRVGDLAGGLQAFQSAFWSPFRERLQALRREQRFDHRLVAIVAEYSGDVGGWGTATAGIARNAARPDYSKLLLLPRLEPFVRQDVLDWLYEMNVPDHPAGRWKLLVDRALKNGQGADDPVPIRVFDRLKGESLSPQGEPR